MKKQLDCPLCHEKVYSEAGEGCKMCGMPVENKKEFCSDICKKKHKEINKLNH